MHKEEETLILLLSQSGDLDQHTTTVVHPASLSPPMINSSEQKEVESGFSKLLECAKSFWLALLN